MIERSRKDERQREKEDIEMVEKTERKIRWGWRCTHTHTLDIKIKQRLAAFFTPLHSCELWGEVFALPLAASPSLLVSAHQCHFQVHCALAKFY